MILENAATTITNMIPSETIEEKEVETTREAITETNTITIEEEALTANTPLSE